MPARRVAVAVVAVCALNVAFQSNAQWMLHTGSVKRTLASLGDGQRLFARYAPERVLASAIRDKAPRHGLVLVLHSAAYAEFAGMGRTTARYDPALQAAGMHADRDGSGETWAALWRREGIAELVLRNTELSPAQRAGLSVARAHREMVVGDAQWWRLPGATP